MGQTKLVSLIEQILNVASGFVLSVLVWQTVGPLFGYEVTIAANLGITSIFTVVSVVRGYIWRRFFNANLHEAVVRWVRNFAG
jgi:low affinity Fe/Cu permease